MTDPDPTVSFRAQVDQFRAMTNEMASIWGDYWVRLMDQKIPHDVAATLITDAHREFWRKQLGFDV